ncbi:arylacetamide deacetylase-like 3 [Suncus etruscus]|uniref:arylacetamide deacetylase-like 3 n=1 Tax=Suncus etruscus TaxID=109475 RepID=UPI0021102395|nr:arylacetamide deacetylase-like 3 [Suncus etruscus]
MNDEIKSCHTGANYLTSGGDSMLGLLLPWAGLSVACLFFAGIPLWVFFSHFFLIEIPAGISHPNRLRVYHCLFELLFTWGKILEKMNICYRSKLICFAQDLLPLKKDPDVVVTDLCFGTIPVKLYQPRSSSRTLRTGILFYHGGAALIGSLRTHHDICLTLCKESDSVVLSVGYRKMPKYKFPVAANDSMAATIHFLKSLSAFEVDPARVVVCGDSMGGGMAVLMCQKLLMYPHLPKIRAQMAIYPALHGLDFQSPSNQQNNVPFLPRNFAIYCLMTYLSIDPSWERDIITGANLPPEIHEKYRKWLGHENIPERFKKKGYRPKPVAPLNENAYHETHLLLDGIMCPLVVEDEVMSQMPEAFIVTCEYDYLRDNSLLYKKRLEDLGIPVTWLYVEDGFHGALSTLDKNFMNFPCSQRIMNAMVDFIKGL